MGQREVTLVRYVDTILAREYCGALKAVEYEESSGHITIYHTGTHKCHIKPKMSNQLKFACRELLNRDFAQNTKGIEVRSYRILLK